MGEIDKLTTIAELNTSMQDAESENVLTAKLSQMQNGTNAEVEGESSQELDRAT